MLRVQQEPAYLLNRKPYKEGSALVDLLTKQYGRIRLVARGLNRKKSSLAAILQPFQPMLIDWQAKGELGTLTGAEASSAPLVLTGDEYYAAFYLNELLTRVLSQSEPIADLFIHYAYSLARLAEKEGGLELILRQFEHELLDDLGYSLPHQEWVPSSYYQWQGEQGMTETLQPGPIQGWHLSQIEQKNLEDAAVLKAAKHLSRQRLAPLIGPYPLKSRQVWMQMKRGS